MMDSQYLMEKPYLFLTFIFIFFTSILITHTAYSLNSPTSRSKHTKSINSGEHTIYLSDEYYSNGFVYSYAVLDQQNFNKTYCAASKCQLSQCSPSWLCRPGANNETAVLGVSYFTSHPSRQQDVAIENALVFANYLYGVNVTATKNLYTVSTNSETKSFLTMQDSIRNNNQSPIRHLLINQCKSNSTQFTRVAIYDVMETSTVVDNNDLGWLKNPKYQGYDGAVGSSEKIVASGLFSDQIKLAVKRAVVQLALEKESNLTEELLNISYRSGGSLMVSSINENVQIDLRAKILNLHITADINNKIKVYAWVVSD